MLKQTISYEDFDGNTVTEDLYFNITKTELAGEIEKANELEQLQRVFTGPTRELKAEEVMRLLDIIKWLIKLSYGVRSADGKRFIKTEQVWEEFTQTAAYDAFLFGLFQTPEKAVQFMIGVVPKDLRGDIEKQTMARMAELKEQGNVVTQESADETFKPGGNIFDQVAADEAQADDTIQQQMPAVRNLNVKRPSYEELLADYEKHHQG